MKQELASGIARLAILAAVVLGGSIWANGGFGDGGDGPLIVGLGDTAMTDAVRTSVTGTHTADQWFLDVADVSGFAIGDEVLLITMVDPEQDLPSNSAGTYSTLLIADIDTGLLVFGAPLDRPVDGTGAQKHQVIRIPHYTDVTVSGTLTCNAWDGATGGVLFFRASGTVTVDADGRIEADAKGYRGHDRQPDNQNGYQGESFLGTGVQSTAANASGGGGGLHSVGGGGGGGHATAGEPGTMTSPGAGGTAIGTADLATLFMGGAGGTGGDNDSNTASNPNGGHGGGIVYMTSRLLTNSGLISANAGNGNANTSQDGGAGGGAGGSVFVQTVELTNAGDITANGGFGFVPPNASGGEGGDGAVGRIRIDTQSAGLVGTVTPAAYGTVLPAVLHDPLPDQPTSTTPYVVEATIQDADGAPASASLWYRVDDGAFTSVPMATSNALSYTGPIPVQPANSNIEYYIQATMTGGDAFAPADAPATWYSFSVNAFPPTGVTTQPNADGSISVSWHPPLDTANLVDYTIYRSETQGTPPSPATLLIEHVTDETYTDATPQDFHTYYYQVEAVYDIGGAPSTATQETSATANNITITTIHGWVTLEGLSNYAGITIDFQPTSPTSAAKTVQTDAFGYFETAIVASRYTLVYNMPNYRDYEILTDASLLEDTDVGTSMLYYLGTANLAGNVAGNWSGIVTIADDVTVPAGDTLTIAPGSEVRFLGSYSLIVNGTLIADGTAVRTAGTILFTSLPRNQIRAPGQWQGIDLNGATAEATVLKGILVEYAVDGVDWTTCSVPLESSEIRYCSDQGLQISDDTSNPTITDVETHDNVTDGLYVYEGNPTLVDIVSHGNSRHGIYYSTNAYGTATDCEFRNNASHGIYMTASSGPTIDQCLIAENGSWGVRTDVGCDPLFRDSTISDNSGYGLRFNEPYSGTWSYPRMERCTVERNTGYGVSYRRAIRTDAYIRECTIRDNGGGGIHLEYDCDPRITSNIITGNASHGIYTNSYYSDPTIERNIVAYNGTDGINRTGHPGSPNILHNTIYGNTGNGIYLVSGGSGTETVQHNIIVNNGGWGFRVDTAIETFSYNDVYENAGGAISNTANLPAADHWVFAPALDTDSYANRAADPEFRLDDTVDLALLPTSALIDAGDSARLDPDGSPPDIGALYYDHGNPHSLAATGYTDQTVSLEWVPVTTTQHGALANYKVYRRETGTRADFSLVGSTSATSFDVTGLINNTVYEFAATGVYENGYESPFLTTVFEKPGTPGISLDPIALKLDVPAEGRSESISISNPGTRDLDVEFLTGRPSGSAQYDGSGDYSNIGHHANLYGMTSLTLECWVYRKNDGHIELISKYYSVYAMYINSSNCLGMYKGMDHSEHRAYSTDYVVPANEWHHLAAVWGGTTLTFYADGEVVAVFEDVSPDAIPSHGYNLQLGRRSDTGNYYLNGNLAECRVWSIARTQADIRRQMRYPLQGTETGLVGYWPLDSEHQFTDLSPYQKNAGHSNQAYLNSSFSPPASPAIPVDFAYMNAQTIAPGEQGSLPLTIPDTGTTGTFTYTSPVITNTSDAPEINYEFALTYGSPTPSTPVHFSPVADTGVVYQVVINNAVLDGVALGVGDEIGVFDEDLCVGAAIYDGSQNISITTFQTVPAELKAGFTPGNAITFLIYDTSAALEGTTQATFTIGDGTYGYGLFSAVDLVGTVYKRLDIALTPNQFNLISFNLLPRDSGTDAVFGDLASLQIAHDDAGKSLIPAYDLDSIRDIDFRKGYHVFCASNETMAYEGTSIDAASWLITLKPNQWNSVAFLGAAAQDVTTAFPTDIRDRLDIVQDSAGNSWIPALGDTNDIGNLQPGMGYQIAINGETDVPFAYQPGQAVGTTRSGARSAAPAFASVPASGLPFTVVVSSVSLAGAALPVGASVGVFDGDICVGATAYEGGDYLKIVAWERYAALGLDGFTVGHPMDFRISADIHGQPEVFTPTIHAVRGQGTFKDSSYAIVALTVGADQVGPVVEMIEVVDSSQTVPGVTNNRLVHVYIQTEGVAENALSWLITESAERPGATDPAWQNTKPTSHTIAGNEGAVELFIWTRDAKNRVSLLHRGSHEQIVLDLGLVFTIRIQNADVEALTFGQWNWATDGFDTNLDEEIPSSTRSGQARIFFPDDTGGRRLAADFRPATELTRWRVRVEALPDGETCALDFDLPELPDGKQLFWQKRHAESGEGPVAPILTNGQVTVTTAGEYELSFGEARTTEFTLALGWNLVCLPHLVAQRVGEIFADPNGTPLIAGAVWSWQAGAYRGLRDEDPVQAEAGGWVFSPTGGTTRVCKGLPADGVIALEAGWNLAGPVAVTPAPGSDTGVDAIWGWNAEAGTYDAVTPGEQLQPFRGYWMHASKDTLIRLHGEAR